MLDKPDFGATLGFIHVMGRDEDRDAAVAEVVEQIPDLLAMDRIETGSRFVEKEQRRIVDERARHRQHLAHPAGKFAGHGVPFFFQIGQVQQTREPLRQFISRHPAGAGEKANVFFDGQVAIEAETLRDVAELISHLVAVAPDIHARDLRPAAAGMNQSTQHPDRRRLARAICAEETEDRSRRDRERKIADRVRIAVGFAEAVEKDGRFAHGNFALHRSFGRARRCRAIRRASVTRGGSTESRPTRQLLRLQPKHYGIDVPSSKWKTELVKHRASPPSKKTCAFSLFFAWPRS